MKSPWVSVNHAAAYGWYSVLMCWAPEEGWLPSSALWNGKEWVTDHYLPIGFVSPQPFDTDSQALLWAYANDVEVA